MPRINATREFAVLVVLAESFLPQLTRSQSRADSLRYARAQIHSLFPVQNLRAFRHDLTHIAACPASQSSLETP